MTTTDLLTQAVAISGTYVQPMLGTVHEIAARARKIAPELRSEEEKQILRIAKVARRNLPLINITTAIQAGGLNEQGLPRLAIASYEMSQAGQATCVQVNRGDGSLEYHEPGFYYHWSFRFPEGTFTPGGFLVEVFSGFREGQTTTPAVPGILRQKNPAGVVLLFEVPRWEEIQYPADPYLLKFVAGDIWAVLGTWNITELELKAFRTARNLGL